jgi:hypothetical protein
MSGRKRHTEVLDFMRTFMVAERTGHWGDLYGPGYREMVAKLVKRGWIEQRRTPAYDYMGSWRLNMQRRNSLHSTAKGRRAIYRIDRHAAPQLRSHSWGTMHGYRTRPEIADWHEQKRVEALTATSTKARNLHQQRTSS